MKFNSNDVSTFGLRGSLDPISWVTVAGEGAWQWGQYIGTYLQNSSRQREAYALDLSAEVRYFTDKYSWKPKLGVEFIWYSGEIERTDAVSAGT